MPLETEDTTFQLILRYSKTWYIPEFMLQLLLVSQDFIVFQITGQGCKMAF